MRNNIKLFTLEEMTRFKEKYSFRLCDDVVLVKTPTRVTAHDTNVPFSINSKERRITFTPEAFDIWSELGTDKYNLLDIQQAVNTLYVTYQTINSEKVRKLIKEGTVKLV